MCRFLPTQSDKASQLNNLTFTLIQNSPRICIDITEDRDSTRFPNLMVSPLETPLPSAPRK